MPSPKLTALDAVLADLGMLVRRARAQTLVKREFVEIIVRLRHGLSEINADPDGILRARLELLVRHAEAETLTLTQFEEITSSIRVRLTEHRSEPMTIVPNFAVLPHGIHGRRYGRFTVIDGAASIHPETHLKGA